MDKLSDMFGFKDAKPATGEVVSDAPSSKSAPKATEPTAKSDGMQRATNRDAPLEKPAGDAKKVPIQPAEALNFAKAVLSGQ